MDYKIILTLIGVALSLYAAIDYINDVRSKKIKPHAITWLIWSVLATTGCIIQVIGGGGLGAAVLGATAFMNLIILALSLGVAKDIVTRFDLVILGLATVSLISWAVTSSPKVSVIMLTFTMLMGYVPTYKKAYLTPSEESIPLFFLSGVKQLVGIGALSAYNVLTLLFPAVLLFTNFGLAGLIFFRRKQIKS